MNRRKVAVLLVLLVFVPAVVFLGAAYFDDSHKILRLAQVDGVTMYVPVDLPEELVASNRVHTEVKTEASPATSPKVKLTESRFDFGNVEPFQSQRHSFVIENTGTAPLLVFNRGTSCKCLSAEILDKSIPPGRNGRVKLAWSALPTREQFNQRVTLATNDPENETIELVVEGRTKAIIAASPAELVAPRVRPNEEVKLHTDVLSEIWARFEVVDLKSQLPGLEWEVQPIAPEKIHELGAKAGVHLVVTLPRDVPQGVFLDELLLSARPVDAAGKPSGEPFESSIPLAGKVEGRLIVYGEGLTPEGVIDVGRVESDRGYQGRFLVKVNDEHSQLEIAQVDVAPEFVQARLVPHPQIHRPGVYQLEVEIPPGAAPGNYRGHSLGHLQLAFDHPRIDSLTLALSFFVPNERPRLHELSMASQSP